MSAEYLLQRWYRFLGAGPLVMLLALLPGLLFIDHWGQYAGLIPVEEENLAEHAGHCHLNIGTCSDQPLPPDMSVTPAVVHVVEPELTLLALEDHLQRLSGHIVVPPTEPPRSQEGTWT